MTWRCIEAWKKNYQDTHERIVCQGACIEVQAEVATAQTLHPLLPEHDACQESAT